MPRPGESTNPPVQPNVYLPYVETDPPPYEAYRDPAAAHGWENAYDETSELPRIAQEPAPPAYDPHGYDAHAYDDPQAAGGRADRRRAARGPRRAVAALGAVGVASVAALVAGFAFTGSSDDTEKGGPEGTRSAAPDSAGEAESPSLSPETDAGRSAGTGTSPTVAQSTPSSAPTSSEPPTAFPSAAPATGSAPSAGSSAPVADSGKGNPKGRGKKPR
ncbi:hypothetical protein P1P75_27150 [Streptomyces sp. ID05-39B]|uniref:hypothetical protein n=1 Tax=Streptomyces sp. ID05-39B TaxID=3028664 RepID=UPI0029B84262|nr:hypothetical protein [Streptomyces sp. ID05-39B]MDX3529994.1 hypothetical protein [Streptomyces sp. ID05-39B]